MTEKIDQFRAVLDRIEGSDFAYEVGLASGLDHAIKIVSRQPAVQTATKLLRGEPQLGAEALDRVRDLSARSIDLRYESPYDAALLGTLVVVRDATDREVTRAAARLALSAPNSWWSGRLARHLLAHVETRSATASAGGRDLGTHNALLFGAVVAAANISLRASSLSECFVDGTLAFLRSLLVTRFAVAAGVQTTTSAEHATAVTPTWGVTAGVVEAQFVTVSRGTASGSTRWDA